LIEGCVGIYKEDDSKSQRVMIKKLNKGDFFGELVFLSGGERVSSVIAESNCKVLSLCKSDILKVTSRGNDIINQIVINSLTKVTSRIDAINEQYKKSLLDKVSILNEQNHFGLFFVILVFAFSMMPIINGIFITVLKLSPFSNLVNWTSLIVYFIPVLVIFYLSHYSLEVFGITLRNWKKVTVEALILSAIVIVLMGFASLIIDTYTQMKPGYKLTSVWVSLGYIIHSFIQELIARGLILNSLLNFFKNKSKWFSIIISSVIFANFHLHYGLLSCLSVFVFSIAACLLYLHQKSLLGVTIFHYLVGIALLYYIGI